MQYFDYHIAQDGDGDSALMMAAREGAAEVVSLLLQAGANIHLRNKVKCVQESI